MQNLNNESTIWNWRIAYSPQLMHGNPETVNNHKLYLVMSIHLAIGRYLQLGTAWAWRICVWCSEMHWRSWQGLIRRRSAWHSNTIFFNTPQLRAKLGVMRTTRVSSMYHRTIGDPCSSWHENTKNLVKPPSQQLRTKLPNLDRRFKTSSNSHKKRTTIP